MDNALALAIGDMIGIFLVVGLLFAFAIGMTLTFAYQAIRYWPSMSRKEGRKHVATKVPREHPRAA